MEQDRSILIDEVRAIATFGFEQGFRQAIDLIQGVAEEGNGEDARKIAGLLVATLEQALPEIMKSVPEMFTFQIIDDGSGKNKRVMTSREPEKRLKARNGNKKQVFASFQNFRGKS